MTVVIDLLGCELLLQFAPMGSVLVMFALLLVVVRVGGHAMYLGLGSLLQVFVLVFDVFEGVLYGVNLLVSMIDPVMLVLVGECVLYVDFFFLLADVKFVEQVCGVCGW